MSNPRNHDVILILGPYSTELSQKIFDQEDSCHYPIVWLGKSKKGVIMEDERLTHVAGVVH